MKTATGICRPCWLCWHLCCCSDVVWPSVCRCVNGAGSNPLSLYLSPSRALFLFLPAREAVIFHSAMLPEWLLSVHYSLIVMQLAFIISPCNFCVLRFWVQNMSTWKVLLWCDSWQDLEVLLSSEHPGISIWNVTLSLSTPPLILWLICNLRLALSVLLSYWVEHVQSVMDLLSCLGKCGCAVDSV